MPKSPSVSWRPATPEDIPSLEPLARQFYEESVNLKDLDWDRFRQLWEVLLGNQVGFIAVAERDGKIIAAIGGVIYPDAYSQKMIATEFFWFALKEHRGFGLPLLRMFEQWAACQGASEVRMVHLSDVMSDKLSRVYRKLGYRPIETHYAKEVSS